MEELQAARQRGLIAYFSETKLLTRMERTTTHSSHENVASFGTADDTAARDDAQDAATLCRSLQILE